MRAGQLRHRVTIQEVTETRDNFGGIIKTWSDVATVWATVEPLRGREFFDAQQVNAEVTHRVTIRYYSGISPKMRLKFGTRYFNIESITNIDERDKELQLMCKEVV